MIKHKTVLFLCCCFFNFSLFIYAQSFSDEYGLSVHSDKDQAFFSVATSDKQTIITDRYESNIIRKIYDDHAVLLKEEEWQIPSDDKDPSLLTITEYIYTPDTTKLVQSIQYNYAEKKIEKTEYLLPYGLVQKITFAHYEGDTLDSVTTDSITTYAYDTQQRVTEKKDVLFTSGKHTKRQVYTYTTKTNKPDYVYYEDGKVRVRTVYSSNTDYTQTSYFDDGYSVVATYVDGEKKTETYLLNGRTIKAQ